MQLPKKVTIREVGPREGFQTLSTVIPTEKKCELITALAATGVQSVEVTSFVRPDRVPQMADAEELVRMLPVPPGQTSFTALYLNQKGFERSVGLPNIENHGWLYTATSETFLRKNNNCSFEETVNGIQSWIELFKKHNVALRGVVVSTAFGCGYEGKGVSTNLRNVLERFRDALAGLGVNEFEVSLADTVGMAVPPEIRSAVELVRDVIRNVSVSLHLHDTRGMGMACAYEGLQSGVQIFEGSVGGLGGCPFAKGATGNIATEDFVYLCHELGIETGVSLEKYIEAARLAARIVGKELPGRVYKIPETQI